MDEDKEEDIRGRLEKSFLKNACKHEILFPKVGKTTDLLIKHYHKLPAHSRRGIIQNEIRSSGYWIPDANLAVRKIMCNCVECCRHRGRLREQKMASLPF